MVLILLLRQDPEQLSPTEKECIALLYPEGVEYRRIDLADYLDHNRICQELHPVAVILPKEKPIPSLAMENGYRHITFSAQGPIELLPLRPEFKPFIP